MSGDGWTIADEVLMDLCGNIADFDNSGARP